MTLLRGYADDMVLQDWLAQKIWPLEAHLTGRRRLLGDETRLPRDDPERDHGVQRHVLLHGRCCPGGRRGRYPCHALATGLSISSVTRSGRPSAGPPRNSLTSYVRRTIPGSRRRSGPTRSTRSPPQGLKWCAEFAKEQEIGIHIHLSETEKEVNDCVAQHGKRPASPARRMRDPYPEEPLRPTAAGSTKRSARLLGKRGVHVSHNPASNMKLATNRAMPWHELTRAGANACLGTDGCASNNNLDMFEEAKIAALLQKFYWNNPTLLPAPAALAMATSHRGKGARVRHRDPHRRFTGRYHPCLHPDCVQHPPAQCDIQPRILLQRVGG